MTTKETIKILENYNAWRRDSKQIKMPNPTTVGKAIDSAIEKLKKIEDAKDDKCDHPYFAQSFSGSTNKRHCSICGKYFI